MRWGLLLVLMLPVAYGAGIDTAITTVDMDTNSVDILSQYAIVGDSVEDIAVVLPSDAVKIKADMDGERRTCMFETSNVTTARCGSTKEGKHIFTIGYRTRHPVVNVERLIFKFTEHLPFKAAEHTFLLKLPVGYVVSSEEGKDPTFFLNPTPAEVLSDGQRILISWKNEDISQFSASAITQSIRGFNWLFISLGIIVAALAGAGTTWYVLHRKKKKEDRKTRKEAKEEAKKEVKKELVPQFIEHERMVVDILSKTEGHETWQKQLLLETKFSKAKLSRIIKNLEQRGVVKKTVYGNTNKISLKK